MAEWTASHDYATRVNNPANGGGLNGSYTLTPGATVFDDGAVTVPDAGAGRDLFFANLTDTVPRTIVLPKFRARRWRSFRLSARSMLRCRFSRATIMG